MNRRSDAMARYVVMSSSTQLPSDDAAALVLELLKDVRNGEIEDLIRDIGRDASRCVWIAGERPLTRDVGVGVCHVKYRGGRSDEAGI